MKMSVAAVVLLFVAGHSVAGQPTLREAFASKFRMGVALGTKTVMQPERDVLAMATEQFNSATPENCMKWGPIHPRPGEYDFAGADRFVELGEQHDWWLVGHTLIWHQQTPDWVFEDEQGRLVSRDTLIARMGEHIRTVVGRYRGRVHAWDVVNEALNDDGSLRDTKWRRVIGDDYLDHAFRFAHDADPDAELYYNDYSLFDRDKSRGAVRLVRQLKESGRRIDGVGMQGHWSYNYPDIGDIERSIKSLGRAAGKVMISELDVNMLPWPGDKVDADLARRAIGSPEFDPFTDGLPPEKQKEQAGRYAAFFRLFVRHHDIIDRVTFWGPDDGRHWHNSWPIEGRTAHSMLFDRQLQAKPAFDAVIAVGEEQR